MQQAQLGLRRSELDERQRGDEVPAALVEHCRFRRASFARSAIASPAVTWRTNVTPQGAGDRYAVAD